MITGDERELLAGTLAQVVEGADSAEALDGALVEVGWADALADDPRTAVSLLFEQQGRHATTSSALDAVLAHGLGVDSTAGVAVVLPRLDGSAPGRPAGGGVDVHGLATVALAGEGTAWVACGDGDGGAVAVAVDALERHPVGGLDPSLGLVEVRGQAVAVVEQGGPWAAAVRLGRLALAHELVGASRTMLQLARDHAVERVQFGQPIARFQAVRHRLAEALVAVEAADAAVESAWDDGGDLAAAAAKAVAGRSARTVARHAQQVLAGIGFTTEHPLHAYVRRALVLDGLLDSAHALTRSLGADLLQRRGVPPLVPL